jgi:hypothetical protein
MMRWQIQAQVALSAVAETSVTTEEKEDLRPYTTYTDCGKEKSVF